MSLERSVMWRLGLYLVLLTVLVRGDDFPAPCAQTPLCSKLRGNFPEDNEIYNAKFTHEDGFLHFNLTNGLGNELMLTIKAVVDDTFRITIEEPDKHRFHLEHSLKKEPTYTNLTVTTTNSTHLNATDGRGNRVEVVFEALHIRFYRDDILESIFEGRWLRMENTEDSQAFTFAVKFKNAKRLTGLFEHSGILSLNSTVGDISDPYRLKNLDLGRYRMNWTQGLYGNVPLIYGLGNQTSGLFVHNAAEMWVDINTTIPQTYFMVNGGVLDLFVLIGPTLPLAVRQYTNLTGTAHMPQLWVLGYHQSRFGYKTEGLVKEIVTKFDEYNMPLETVWLDLDWTDGGRWFVWNSTAFPDPVGLLDWVESQGSRKIVALSDCHLKVDPNYKIYAEFLENDYFINNPDGSAYVGTCWPGDASWIDFLNPDARIRYSSLYSYENYNSTPTLAGIWNDMNEPATFDLDKELTIPYDLIQYGNVLHRDVHNIYGLLQVMSTHQGLIDRDEGKKRPFILSRSFFAGAQRYTAKWAGDTDSSFNYQRVLVPMTISANLAGLALYGGDIPGFFLTPSDEIATRFYQLGAWIPFYRAHADNHTLPREPWLFSNETQNYIRDSLQIRYQHLPYWYRLFYEYSVTGDPVIRPLVYEYPDDDVVYDINDEFLVGSDILVTNVYFSNATSLRGYFPGSNTSWFQMTGNTNDVYEGGDWYDIPVDISFMPVFYRSGSIITRKSQIGRSTEETKDYIYDLHVVVGKDGTATTREYVDDFESFEYLGGDGVQYFGIDYTDVNSTLTARPIKKPVNVGEVDFKIKRIYIYRDLGNGTYSTEVTNLSTDGASLISKRILQRPISI